MHAYNIIMHSKTGKQDIGKLIKILKKNGYNITELNAYINWREFCDYKKRQWLPVCDCLCTEMLNLYQHDRIKLILD